MGYRIDADFLETISYEVENPYSLRSYSGRGMYGRQCLGFVGSISEFTELVLAIAQSFDFDIASRFAEVSTDSMGLSSIFYWPGIKLSDDADVWLEENGGN